MNNIEFVKRVQDIAATNPTYRTGGDGSDGTCDCVGLIMGAIDKAYPMHSSNYFARNEMYGLGMIVGNEHHMALGDLVYKARSSLSYGYDLHERYQVGGRYHNGDMLDYYHVGVVTCVDPLEITHCTSTENVNGIKRDNSLKGWTHFGQIKDVIVVGEAEEQFAEAKMMMVYAANKKPVNVRKRPDKSAPKIAEIPVGSVVLMIKKTDEWALITHASYTGYMMSEFLREPGQSEQRVTIELSRSAAEELLNAISKILT